MFFFFLSSFPNVEGHLYFTFCELSGKHLPRVLICILLLFMMFSCPIKVSMCVHACVRVCVHIVSISSIFSSVVSGFWATVWDRPSLLHKFKGILPCFLIYKHEFSSEHRNSDCNAGPVRVVIPKLTRTEHLQRRQELWPCLWSAYSHLLLTCFGKRSGKGFVQITESSDGKYLTQQGGLWSLPGRVDDAL